MKIQAFQNPQMQNRPNFSARGWDVRKFSGKLNIERDGIPLVPEELAII